MNDILIPWEKITRGLPNGRRYADDRALSIDEIVKIIRNYSSDEELVKHIDSEHSVRCIIRHQRTLGCV